MTKEELKNVANSALCKFNMARKGWTWYSDDGENIVAVDLQKSDYGLNYYVNLCCSPEGITVEGSPTPKEHKFPIRIRGENAFPDQADKIKKMFNLDESFISDSERSEFIFDFLFTKAGPFLQEIKSVSGLKRAIAEGDFERGLINRAAQSRLEL
jgi:hypothetical protein